MSEGEILKYLWENDSPKQNHKNKQPPQTRRAQKHTTQKKNKKPTAKKEKGAMVKVL